MGDQDNEFGAPPETASSDGWNIVDGGMERETAESLTATLANDNPTPPAADPDTDDAARVEAGNDETTGDQPTPQAAKPAPAAPAKKPHPAERRVGELRAEINALSGQRHRTRAEAAAAQRELDDLNRQLADARKSLAGGGKPAAETPAAAAKPETQAPAAGGIKKPVWKEFDAEGKDWDEFLEAQDAYLEAKIEASTGAAKQAFKDELDKIRHDADAAAHDARIDGEHRARVRATKEAHPDFAEAIANLKDVEQTDFMVDIVKMHPQGAELLYQLGKQADLAAVLTTFDFTREMFNALMESQNPAAVLLALASDEDEFARIRQMPPSQAMFALGALDARHASSVPATRERPASRGASVSSAPAPIRPVGSGGKAPVSDDDSADDDTIPFEQWAARENARDAKKSRLGAY